MELELTKAVLPALGGAMALAGGIFTFVNGRLNEAKGPNDRSRVISWALFGIVMASNTGAIAAAVLLNSVFVFLALMTPGFAIGAVLFVRNPRPARRAEILQLCIMTGVFSSSVVLAVSLHFIGRIVDIIRAS